jgi:hypothetical protein
MDISTLKQNIDMILVAIDPTAAAKGVAPRLAQVVRIFNLPDRTDSHTQIMTFLFDYVRSVPANISTLDELGRRHKITDLLQPYINLASNYLDSTSRTLQQQSRQGAPVDAHEHLLAILQGAYIFNRLLEELNDEIENFIGIPLLGVNVMTANIIVHDIIGDTFANRLDKIIESMVEQSTVTKSIIEAQLASQHVNALKHAGHALSGEPVTDFAGQHNLSMF